MSQSIQEVPEPPTPSSAYYSLAPSDDVYSDDDTEDYEPSIVAPTIAVPPASTLPPLSQSPTASPKAHIIQHRLSFISYADLLASAPTTGQSLEALTHSTQEPKSIVLDDTPATLETTKGSRRTSWIGNSPRRAGSSSPGDINLNAGEWEREGLRGGLEERLENLLSFESMNKA